MYIKALSAHVVVGLVAGFALTVTEVTPALAQAAPPAKGADAAAAKPAPAKPATPPSKKQRDAARKAYSDGEKSFAAGNYDLAITNFQKANEAVPSPHAEYWIAKSVDAQDKTEEAIAAYEKFLANPDAGKAGDAKVAESKARIEALKSMLVAELVVETIPPNATITVDGAPVPGAAPQPGAAPAGAAPQPGAPPAGAPPAGAAATGPEAPPPVPVILKLTPGKHRVTVSAPGYLPKDLDLEVKGGDKLKHSISLAKEPPPPVAVVAAVAAPPPPPPPPPEPRSKVPAYVTLGIAGAAAVVGTIFGVQALSSKSEFDDTPTTELADDTERNALIADMAFGVAITLGVTGIVLLTSDEEAAPAPAKSGKLTPVLKTAKLAPAPAKLTRGPQLDVRPYGGPKSGGATARLTF